MERGRTGLDEGLLLLADEEVLMRRYTSSRDRLLEGWGTPGGYLNDADDWD